VPAPLLALAPVVPAIADRYGLPRRCAAPGAVALTFDDGPHPQGTPRVLEILAAHDARATFFLVGEQVERRPALAAEIVAAGHVVALHAHRHRCQLRLTRRQLAEDLARGAEAVASATGAEPDLHRPPYGIYSAHGLKLARRRYAPILWSRWGKDWRRLTTAARISSRAADGLSSGDVILLHDADFYSSRGSWRRTVEALPSILQSARMDRLSIVPLGRDMLG
jgi:peptidoglycan/xylan/chitin deacetylase (PgdA/CDA1 family)